MFYYLLNGVFLTQEHFAFMMAGSFMVGLNRANPSMNPGQFSGLWAIVTTLARGSWVFVPCSCANHLSHEALGCISLGSKY